MASFTSLSTAVLVSLTLALAGCSGSSTGGDAGVADGGRSFDAAVDAGIAASSDIGVDIGMDAPSDTGADIGVDAPSFACAVVPGAAPCDGMSRTICTEWAQRTGARWTEPASSCVQGSLDGCARGDACDDIYDIATCHCGADPSCGAGEVCARERAGDARRCLPCSAD